MDSFILPEDYIKQLEAENRRLRNALGMIAYPNAYLVHKAESDGARLNGQAAVDLTNDASWLKDIARRALEGA